VARVAGDLFVGELGEGGGCDVFGGDHGCPD
jgi:hypothetical protein